MKKISSPLDQNIIKGLKAGDEVLLSGIIYTARDQAHKRLTETLRLGKRLPFDLKGQVIYYCGPARTPIGRIIGSCGPTTSSRMDEFTPALLKAGVSGMIGKGERSQEVRRAIKKYKGIYFITHAGCAALLSRCVTSNRPVSYKDLGPEAICRLTVKDFPLVVATDAKGKSVYD